MSQVVQASPERHAARPPIAARLPANVRPAAAISPADPLDDDTAADAPVLTTSRRLGRLALLAATVGARSVREPGFGDAYEWLVRPRELFDGRCALQAAQEVAHLRHGLIMIDVIGADDAGADAVDDLLNVVSGPGKDPSDEADATAGPRLYTCSFDAVTGQGRFHVFRAVVAPSAGTLRAELAARYGRRVVDAVTVREGYDPSEPIAASLVSEVTTVMLLVAAADPQSQVAAGLEVRIERRFAS